MIEFDKLDDSYPGGAVALKGVTALVGDGIHLLLGENGAGKTTLLHVMAGLLRPQSGKCLVDGVDVARRLPSTMASLFLVGENPDFGCHTINEFAERHAVFYPTFSREVLEASLVEFGLTGDEPMASLSLGGRKRSCIAYAVALRTSLLLLDEPANGLDIDGRKALQRVLAAHVGEGQTVVVSTHTVWDLKNLFDGVIVLAGARLLLARPVVDVTARMAFVNSWQPLPDAVYSENRGASYGSIIDAAIHGETDIDYQLLYSALHSNRAQEVLKMMNDGDCCDE